MSMIRGTNEKTFNDIYCSADDFIAEANEYGFTQTISDDSKKTLFYLLTAKYGDNRVIGYDNEARWKIKLWSIVWQYGSEWEKKIAIQDELKKMNLDDAMVGAKVINNLAMNPQSTPKTSDLTELGYINQQSSTNYKKSRIEAASVLWAMLTSSVTDDFIKRFKSLFNPYLTTSDPLYIYEEEDHE